MLIPRRPLRTAREVVFAAALASAVAAAAPLGGCSVFQSDRPGGIRARLGYSESGGLRVAEVPPGPAERAGLREDDRVTRIDGRDVSGMQMREIVERLRGPVGSTVEIEVVRDGEFQVFEIERVPYHRDEGPR